VEALQRRERQLESRLDSFRDKIHALEASHVQLTARKNELKRAQTHVSALQDRGEALRREPNAMLAELTQIRLMLRRYR
jgi:prefoldin subunit 5